MEFHSRKREENARTGHLNRAQDVQILREQPWNVITNASRLEGVDGGPARGQGGTVARWVRPTRRNGAALLPSAHSACRRFGIGNLSVEAGLQRDGVLLPRAVNAAAQGKTR